MQAKGNRTLAACYFCAKAHVTCSKTGASSTASTTSTSAPKPVSTSTQGTPLSTGVPLPPGSLSVGTSRSSSILRNYFFCFYFVLHPTNIYFLIAMRQFPLSVLNPTMLQSPYLSGFTSPSTLSRIPRSPRCIPPLPQY